MSSLVYMRAWSIFRLEVNSTDLKSYPLKHCRLWMDNESCFEAHLAKVKSPSMVFQHQPKVEQKGSKNPLRNKANIKSKFVLKFKCLFLTDSQM